MLRLNRLSVMRQGEREGPMHFKDLTYRIRSNLDPADTMTERNVHAWLDRYDDLFVWVGPGTYLYQ